MSATLIGPVHIKDTTKDSGRTTAQVMALNTFDSRLTQSRNTYITPTRIRAIRNDPTVQLARQAVVSPMIHTPWEYVAKENAPSDAADYIKSVFEVDRDWWIQNAIYGALDFGWQPFEVVYAYEDGQIKISEFKQLLQDFTTILVYENNGRFAGFLNEPLTVGAFARSTQIPIPYALNINLTVEGTDWYGLSISKIIDPIVTNWDDVNDSASRYDKKIAGATWVIYFPVGQTMFNGTLTANDTIARTLLQTLEASGQIAVPDDIQEFLDDSMEKEMRGKWRVELVAATSTAAASFVERQKYLDNLKLRAFGLTERSLVEGKFGTKAEAETHADVSLMTIDTKHRLSCDQLNKYAVSPLLRFQYGAKYANCVIIQPAPLVDAQFQTVKEIYRLIMQSPQIIEREIQNIDVQSLRNQVGVPTVAGAKNDFTPLPVETVNANGTNNVNGKETKQSASDKKDDKKDKQDSND